MTRRKLTHFLQGVLKSPVNQFKCQFFDSIRLVELYITFIPRMNKAALLALIALSIGLLHLAEIGGQEENHGFSQFQVEYQKKYLREGEEQYRKQVFLKNVQNINKHNSDPQQTYTQGVNQFTDLTPEEFKALYLGLNLQRPSSQSNEVQVEDLQGVNTDIDWVAAGKVNPIQDQGQCGASWAFSAVAAIESAYMIKGTKQIKLSEQQMLDCTQSYGNYGCNGGFMSNTFKYVQEKGIHSSKDYPYVGRAEACKTVSGQSWKISSYGDSKGCDFLLSALTKGPVSVAVDATNFYSYKSGIITKCGNTPNSGSLVVGLTDTYWLLKESFGTKFGDNGYVRIAPGNTCAVCEIVSYPQL